MAGADPAEPGRFPGADGRTGGQRGRRAADRDAFPAKGNAADADLPGAHQRPDLRHPAVAGRARRGARQGGERPDARRPGDDPLHRRLRRRPRRSALPDARGARRRLGRPLLRGRRGHHPCRAGLPEPADASSPRPGSRSSSNVSGWPSTPAAPAGTAAASATTSTSGCWWTRTSCRSPTGRSWPAGAWPAAGPGQSFSVTIDPGGPNERDGRRARRWRSRWRPAR